MNLGTKEKRAITLLSLVFFFSGMAALMYQVAWQRLLTVYYGVGPISIALIVSIYMFGLGVGALLGGYLSEKTRRLGKKIILYFLIEMLIGCFGLASPVFLDFLGRNTAGSTYQLSFLYMVIFLSVPTILMGITLPLLTKIFNSLINDFLRSVSFLYFINTIGAAFGALFAAYTTISFWGLDNTVYTAAVINFLLGLLIFFAKFLLQKESYEKVMWSTTAQVEPIMGTLAYPVVFITGFLAIGYEIIWFRVMGVLLKSSPYIFPSVLSVYLSGIAIGSLTMDKFLKTRKSVDKKSLFFILQFLIGIYVLGSFISYFYLTKNTFLVSLSQLSFQVNFHPHMKMPSTDSIINLMRDLYTLFDVFFWPLIFVLIPTILMGASFPLISFLALSQKDKEGKTVGTVYFFNIVGNVLGAIMTGFILLPNFGTEQTLLSFALVGISFGFFIKRIQNTRKINFYVRYTTVFITLIAGILFFPARGNLYEAMHTVSGLKDYERYFDEGVEGVVMTYKQGNNILTYVNGHLEGKRPLPVGYFWNMEALSHARKNEKILIIGYAGSTVAEAVLNAKGVKEVTIVELNGTLIKNLQRFDLIKKTLSDPRLKLIIEDGRRYLLTTDEKYDVILMETLRQPNAYSNNLYSKQFLQIIEEHLNKGGVFLVREPAGAGMLKTFLTVFDYVKRYREFSLVSNSPLRKNTNYWYSLLEDIPSDHIRKRMLSLSKKKTEVLTKNDLLNKEFSYYSINTDWKPMSEYYMGQKIRGILFIPKNIHERFKTPYGY